MCGCHAKLGKIQFQLEPGTPKTDGATVLRNHIFNQPCPIGNGLKSAIMHTDQIKSWINYPALIGGKSSSPLLYDFFFLPHLIICCCGFFVFIYLFVLFLLSVFLSASPGSFLRTSVQRCHCDRGPAAQLGADHLHQCQQSCQVQAHPVPELVSFLTSVPPPRGSGPLLRAAQGGFKGVLQV